MSAKHLASAEEVAGTCEDHSLMAAGYTVCGSAGDTQWHWQEPTGCWHDGYRTEYAAVNAALKHLASALQPSAGEQK
jgi:hypothetical protein